MYGSEAAELGAKRDTTGNALVNTAAIGPLAIYFWPASMALSASQTKNINKKGLVPLKIIASEEGRRVAQEQKVN
jgi:hypothetical protein